MVSDEEIARAMKAANGEYDIAARVLGMSTGTLLARVQTSTELRAIYQWERKPADGVGPMEEAIGRSAATATLAKRAADSGDGNDNELLAHIVSAENSAILRGGLRQAGISQKTVNRLEALQSVQIGAGEFLVASLDMAHKMAWASAVDLFDQAEMIRAEYLNKEGVATIVKLEWTKVYVAICEQLGKFYDRTLIGTEALVRILAGQKGGKKKPPNARRRGFSAYPAPKVVTPVVPPPAPPDLDL